MSRFRKRNRACQKTSQSFAIQSAPFCWPFHIKVGSLHRHSLLHWLCQLLLLSRMGCQSHNASGASHSTLWRCAPAWACATARVANNCEIESNCGDPSDEAASACGRHHMTWGHEDTQMFCLSVCLSGCRRWVDISTYPTTLSKWIDWKSGLRRVSSSWWCCWPFFFSLFCKHKMIIMPGSE